MAPIVVFEVSKDLQFAIGMGTNPRKICLVFHGMVRKRQLFKNYNNLDVFSNL